MSQLHRTVLVVEDDEPKLRSILSFLREQLPQEVEITAVNSLSGAVNALSSSTFALAVVDMSLPTFDLVLDGAGGGQPQGFGGADILRFIEAETSSTFSIVLTQYEEFTIFRESQSHDIAGLERRLRAELGKRFLGVVHYSGQHGEWRSMLRDVLVSIGLAEGA